MESLSRYILSVIAAAFLVSMLTALVGKKGSAGAILKLTGGLFLTFTLLNPLVDLDFSGISGFFEEYSVTAEAEAAGGEAMAREEYRTIIKDKLEAYILDKAKELGLAVTAKVTLDADGIPTAVTVSGAASPYAKAQLQQMIVRDLGIAKEDQLWT